MLSIAPGYDPRYLTRQVGRGAENYYLSATIEHGEPPGIWWGEGARALGLEPGSEIDGRVFEPLYEHFLDPRDPDFHNPDVPIEDKARLGRRKSRFASWQEIYERKLLAEPEASAERREELKWQAKGESRQTVIHLDATFSPAKSVTLVHAGLMAAALRAEEAGDIKQAARYRQAADVVWDGVMAGANASLRYLQEHAGEARSGYHGAKVGGRTTGKWVRAGGWVVGQFRQHTNREGDPQLHVHQAILNRQLCEDGKWRSLDSRAIFKARAAAAAHGERVMEEYLTRRLGLKFRSRPDGQGREVVGVSPELIAEFSSRRAQVTADLEKRIEAYVEAHGRQPSPRVLFKMAQDATKATKAAKVKAAEAPSPAEQLREWEERTTAQELDALSKLPALTLGQLNPAETPAPDLTDAEVERVLAAAIADVQRDAPTWTRSQLTRAINRHLPDYLGGLHPERVEALLEQLTDMALVPGAVAPVRLLEAPEVVTMPQELRREDGRSVYLAPYAERYTTATQLDREAALIAAALRREAPRLDETRAAALVGMSVEEAEQAALRGEAAPESEERRPFQDQADALVGILTSGRSVDVLIGAAGTGKSFTVSRLAEIWRAEHGTPALGLATSQNAAVVLKREGLDHAMNIERWLTKVAAGEERLTPGQLIVVDEASMVTTDHLVRIQRLADEAGCKVVWTGDHAQLSAPGAGGAMRRLVNVAGAHELSTVVRFAAQWERDASVRLREGLVEALVEYDHRGRLRGGTRDEMEAAAVDAYLADYLAGKQTLLLAPTNEQAATLAGRIRDELVALRLVDRRGVALRDGNTAGVGDLVRARRNTEIEDAVDELTNRDVLRIELIGEDGTVTARRIGKDGTPGEAIDLSPSYIGTHVELAYAGTVHAAQGRTVDTCHAVVDGSATRQMAYVMMTRGRSGNWAYVVEEDERAADLRPGPEQAADRGAEMVRAALGDEAASFGTEAAPLRRDYIAVLAGVLETEEADQTAIEAMIEEGERPRNLAHLGAILTNEARELVPRTYVARALARGTLNEADAARLHADPALGSLGRLLRQIEMAGYNPDRILDAAITERELSSAECPAKVLSWRIREAARARDIDLDRLEIAEEAIGASWRDRYAVPDGPDARARLLRELADAAEARQAELGQRAVEQQPAWLINAIGAVPEDPGERAEWERRAGAVLAYREQYGYDAETDPIGPAPARTSPEQRAAWWAAYDAIGRPDLSREIAGATDGELWVMRAAYEREVQWAPPYVADELGKVSREVREREAEAVRLRARAAAVLDQEVADGLLARAHAQEMLAAAARERQAALEKVHEARQVWAEATRDVAMQAMRADAELRRREHVNADLLPPLHPDAHDAAERIARQREAMQAEHDLYTVHPDQQELDLGSEVAQATAWETHAERQEADRGDAARQAAVETGREVEDRGQSDGQLTLDVFGSGAELDDQQLAAAVEKATLAIAIAAQRQAEQAEDRSRQAEQEGRQAQQERLRQYETDRAAYERARLEEREAARAQETRRVWEIREDQDLGR